MTDEILTVKHVSRDGGSYCVRCPHCKEITYVEGDDLQEIAGEQYKHNYACGGWFEVDFDARFVHTLPGENA